MESVVTRGTKMVARDRPAISLARPPPTLVETCKAKLVRAPFES
jgi:hypothetical protein